MAPATLAIGTGTGIVLGVVMCAVAPLGLTNDATEPGRRGQQSPGRGARVDRSWAGRVAGGMADGVTAARAARSKP